MKPVLLLKPPFRYFPIGLAHVITALKSQGIAYVFVDLLLEGSQWLQTVVDDRFLAVAIGGLSGDFNWLCDIGRELKQRFPELPFVLGGNITHDMPAALLFDNIPLDYAIVGEGEENFPKLLRCLGNGGQGIANVPGLLYRTRDNVVCHTAPALPINLQALDCYPTWDDIDMAHYLSWGTGDFHSFRGVPILTGRGCTGKCTFCSPTNGAFRYRHIDWVIEELHRIHAGGYDFDGFAFMNEIFYPSRALIRKFTEAYRICGINRPWVCLLRVDVGEEALQWMMAAGCIGVSFGIESGSDRVLKQMQKGTTVGKIKKFAAGAKSAGLPAFGSFMFGNDTETEAEMAATVDLLIEIDTAGPSGLILAYPGTRLYENAKRNGRIQNEREYVRKLDYTTTLETGTFRNTGYLNISGIADGRFDDAVMGQFRRFKTHFYRRHSAVDINLDTMSGSCPVCGTRQEFEFLAHSGLAMNATCSQCYTVVHFAPYREGLMKSHADKMCTAIQGMRRIAVWGVGPNARALQLYDLFGLSSDAICCHVDDTGRWEGKYFFGTPVVEVDQLPRFLPELVIIADSFVPGPVVRRLQSMGLYPDATMHVLPRVWRDVARQWFHRNPQAETTYYARHYVGNLPVAGELLFEDFMDDLADTLMATPDLRDAGVVFMPAGNFSRVLAQRFKRRGGRLSGFLDNYQWRHADNLLGVPLLRPEDFRNVSFDKVLVSTPGYGTQLAITSQLRSIIGKTVENSVLQIFGLILETLLSPLL